MHTHEYTVKDRLMSETGFLKWEDFLKMVISLDVDSTRAVLSEISREIEKDIDPRCLKDPKLYNTELFHIPLDKEDFVIETFKDGKVILKEIMSDEKLDELLISVTDKSFLKELKREKVKRQELKTKK